MHKTEVEFVNGRQQTNKNFFIRKMIIANHDYGWKLKSSFATFLDAVAKSSFATFLDAVATMNVLQKVIKTYNLSKLELYILHD